MPEIIGLTKQWETMPPFALALASILSSQTKKDPNIEDESPRERRIGEANLNWERLKGLTGGIG